jgi:hypothetical protein
MMLARCSLRSFARERLQVQEKTLAYAAHKHAVVKGEEGVSVPLGRLALLLEHAQREFADGFRNFFVPREIP